MSNNKNRRPRQTQSAPEVQGDKEVLSRPIDSLGLPDDTLTLLKNNKFNTVYDIARRTERDMFRVQTFNKKHFMVVKNAIKAVGIDFMPFVPRENPEKDNPNAQQAVPNADKQQNARPRQSADNAARRDVAQQDVRRQQGKPQNGKQPQQNGKQPQQNGKPQNASPQRPQQRPQEPKRPKVELLLEEWEKISKNGKWGFSNGLKTVIEPQFDEVFCFKDGLACVDVGEKFGYIDQTGAFVIAPKYECALSFSEEMAVFFEGEKCGYINKSGDVVIPPKYDAATAFENGRAKVKEAGKWQTIDPDGNTLWSK